MKKTRRIAVAISSVLTAAVLGVTAAAAQFQYRGDINRDDKVNAADGVFLGKYLVKGKYISAVNKKYADVNGDGYINVYDFIALKRIALGKAEPVEITPATTTTAVTTTTPTTSTTLTTTTTAATTSAGTTTTTAETTTTAKTTSTSAATTTTVTSTTESETSTSATTTTTEVSTSATTTTTEVSTSASETEESTTTTTTVAETTTTTVTSTTTAETTTTKAGVADVKSKTYGNVVNNSGLIVNLSDMIGTNDVVEKIVFNFSTDADAIGNHSKQILGFIDGTDYNGTHYEEHLISDEKTASYTVEDCSKYGYDSFFKVYSWGSTTGTTLTLDSVDVYVNGATTPVTVTTTTIEPEAETTTTTTTTTTATESESSDTTSTTVTEETTVSSSEETETTTATTPTEVTGNVIAPTTVDRAMIMHYYNTSDGYMSYSDTSDYTAERLEKYYENVVAPEITSNGDYVAKIVLKDDQKQYIGNSWCAFNILAKEQASLKNKTLTVTDIIVNGESVSNFTATEIIYDEWNKKASLELGNYVPANIEIKSIEIRFTVS